MNNAAEQLEPQSTITRFAKLLDTSATADDIAWPDLFQEFSNKGPFLGDYRHPGWSPANFDPPQREKANVQTVSALVLDIDNKRTDGQCVADPVTIEAMREDLTGCFGFIHTSRNHTRAWPRFRVILPLARIVSKTEYEALWRVAASLWRGLDPQPKDPSRFWYTPGVGNHEGAEFETVTLDGAPVDPDGLLACRPAAPLVVVSTLAENTSDVERARAYVEAMPPAISGQGGHVATFNVARRLIWGFGLSEPNALEIMREYNLRCEPPWSDKDLRHKIESAAANATERTRVEDRTPPPPLSPWKNSDAEAGNASPAPERTGRTIADVLTTWRAEGPLIHEPTGFGLLDELTGGGPVYGSRWYINGQPNACKTLMECEIGYQFARRGIVVGLLAIDEEDGDLVTRFAQRLGHSRKNCEIRSGAVLNQIDSELADLPIRFYDASWTIEAAAADLAKFANGRRMMLGIDSLQTVNCDLDRAAERELSEMAAVTARVQAIRKVATHYRLIAITTSEMSRAAYRKADPDDLTSTMAASKHSGAVEYSARVLLGLRSVKGESDIIEVDVAKNKHGPSGELFYLRVNRADQMLTDLQYEPPPKPSREDAKATRFQSDCLAVLDCLPVAPDHVGRDELLGILGDKGMSSSINSLKPRLSQLMKDGLATDLSDGSKQTARKYARCVVGKA